MGESDPWRRRMRRTAERLRSIDERLFERQISTIEATLDRDANWNLESALACWERLPAQRFEVCLTSSPARGRR